MFCKKQQVFPEQNKLRDKRLQLILWPKNWRSTNWRQKKIQQQIKRKIMRDKR